MILPIFENQFINIFLERQMLFVYYGYEFGRQKPVTDW